MNLIIVKKDKKSFPFFKKYIKEKYMVYEIYSECKLIRNQILKRINKDRIFNVAFSNNISDDFIDFFKGKINIITKEKILFNNLDSIILKSANLIGIKDGKLNLGIIAGYKNDVTFKKLERLKNKLKTLMVYYDDNEDLFSVSDLFFNNTGVPVILRKGFDNISCDILVYLKESKVNLYKFKGQLIDIFNVLNKRAIKDIRVNFKNNDNEYNVSDAVFLKILNEPFKIDSFITKNT